MILNLWFWVVHHLHRHAKLKLQIFYSQIEIKLEKPNFEFVLAI